MIQANPAMPSPAGIPYDVLVHILQHVPLIERMSTCSLVQQSWRAAAAAATTSVTLPGMSAATAAAIARQLASSSSTWTKHITSISLQQHSDPAENLELVLPQVACPKLQQLHLTGFILTPPANAHSSRGDSGSADNGAAGDAGLVRGCPLLQELSLTSCWVELAEGTPVSDPVFKNVMSLLTALTALTRLDLGAEVYLTTYGGDNLFNPNLRPLSALTGLQELGLEKPAQRQLGRLFSRRSRHPQRQGMQLLPSLTKLSIRTDYRDGGLKYNVRATPGLYQLSSLCCLDLRGAEVGSVQQLSTLSSLESLVLHRVTSLRNRHLSAEPDSDSDSEGQDTDGYPSVADIGELLQLLPQLPKLTHLDLWGLAGSKTPVPQWTCLGRCTGLQVLRLQNLFIHKDSWPLMFEGAQLCRLRKLRLHICSEVSDSADIYLSIYVPMPRQVVQQMVDACPNLEVLQLVGNGLLSSGGPNRLPEVRQSPPVSLAPLGQLQHLTSLRVHSVRTQAFADLWRLRQLRHLVVRGRVTDPTLVQLSALTNLTSFTRFGDADNEIETWDASMEHLDLIHSEASPVWQQTLDHCQQSGWCEAVFQHGQGVQAQLAAAQQQLEQQRRQLAQKEQQLAEQQRLVAEQAAELAALKAYLVGQQPPA